MPGCNPNSLVQPDPSNQNEANWRNSPNDLAQAAAELPKAYQEYRAAGFAYSREDLPKVQAMDDSQNSASFLVSAVEKLNAIRALQAEPKFISTPEAKGSPPPRSGQEVDSIAEDYKDPEVRAVFSLVSEGTKKNRLDFHRDEGKNPYSNVQFTDLKKLVQLVSYRAEMEVANGESTAAANSINEAWKLAWLISEDGSTIGDIIACQAAQAVLETVERCLQVFVPRRLGAGSHADSQDSGTKFEDLTSRLSLGPVRLQVARDHTREILNLIAYARQLDGKPESNSSLDFRRPIANRFPSSLKGRAYLARILQFWTSQRANVKELDIHPAAACDKINSALREIDNHRRQSYQLLSDTLGDFGNEGHDIENLERFRVAENLLIRSLRYRVKQGRWPASPADVAENPLDRNAAQYAFASSPRTFLVVHSPIQAGKSIPKPRYRERSLSEEQGVASYPALKFKDARNVRRVAIQKGAPAKTLGAAPGLSPGAPIAHRPAGAPNSVTGGNATLGKNPLIVGRVKASGAD